MRKTAPLCGAVTTVDVDGSEVSSNLAIDLGAARVKCEIGCLKWALWHRLKRAVLSIIRRVYEAPPPDETAQLAQDGAIIYVMAAARRAELGMEEFREHNTPDPGDIGEWWRKYWEDYGKRLTGSE